MPLFCGPCIELLRGKHKPLLPCPLEGPGGGGATIMASRKIERPPGAIPMQGRGLEFGSYPSRADLCLGECLDETIVTFRTKGKARLPEGRIIATKPCSRTLTRNNYQNSINKALGNRVE